MLQNVQNAGEERRSDKSANSKQTHRTKQPSQQTPWKNKQPLGMADLRHHGAGPVNPNPQRPASPLACCKSCPAQTHLYPPHPRTHRRCDVSHPRGGFNQKGAQGCMAATPAGNSTTLSMELSTAVPPATQKLEAGAASNACCHCAARSPWATPMHHAGRASTLAKLPRLPQSTEPTPTSSKRCCCCCRHAGRGCVGPLRSHPSRAPAPPPRAAPSCHERARLQQLHETTVLPASARTGTP